jgi:hypothetical protein
MRLLHIALGVAAIGLIPVAFLSNPAYAVMVLVIAILGTVFR